MEAGTDRCAQPLGAEVNLVPAVAVGRMNDERLQDAALSDVHSKLGRVDSSGNSVRGLCSVLVEQRHGQEQRPSVVAAWHELQQVELAAALWPRYNGFFPCAAATGLMGRCCPWLGVEQVELKLFRLVPRQAHERIVPPHSEVRKYPSIRAQWPAVVPPGFSCTRDIPARPAAVTPRFNFL